MITRHEVTLPYTKAELEALFRLAYAEDLARDGRYRVRPAADRSEWLPAVRQWTGWWQYHDDTTGAMHGHSWEESDLMGAFLVRWGEAPAVWQIEVQEGYTLQEVLQALGRMELQALHDVKHGQAPAEKSDMHEPVEALRAVVMAEREFRRWRWTDGWMFEREPDGSVRIITCQPTREYPLHTIEHETVIPPEEWARILAYLSGAGQDDLSIQAAKRVHATGR